jgi:Ca2+-transporting ATPase
MITGDHPSTATAMAREIGLASKDDKAIAGVDLDKMSDEVLR